MSSDASEVDPFAADRGGLLDDARRLEIQKLIGLGEGQTIEFKASLRCDLALNKINKELTKVVVKTVAGFLNASKRGTLLIGIDDSGEVLGIAPDIESLSKKSLDGFELYLRDALKNYIGSSTGMYVEISYSQISGKVVAKIDCSPADLPVYFRDGDRSEFYLRDGNRTQPLDVRSAHEYIGLRFRQEPRFEIDAMKTVLDEALSANNLRASLGITPTVFEDSEQLPSWLRVATRQVLNLFLKPLAISPNWKCLYIVSPWLSEFDTPAALRFDQFLKRLESDSATAYVVTRPPEPSNDWHKKAVDLLAETKRANIYYVSDLHAKLYTAQTRTGEFALLASANFTQQSLLSREIGVLVQANQGGKALYKELQRQAMQIYWTRGRQLVCHADFK